MNHKTASDERSGAAFTDSTTTDNSDDQKDKEDHDCQSCLEFVEYEWIEDAYDDIYVCDVCEKEYRMVYLKAFLLAEEDFSLVEEYTDEIEDRLDQHLNHDATGQNGVEESAGA